MKHVAASLVLSALLLTPAWAVDVDTCGQTIAKREVGVLQNDLSCPPGVAVTLQHAAVLDMNGHSITGGVVCTGRTCSVVSSVLQPGLLAGTAGSRFGIVMDRGRVENLAIDDFTDVGIVFDHRLDVSDVVISNSGSFGIRTFDGRLRADGLTVVGNEVGIEVGRGKVRGSNITANGNTVAGIFSAKTIGTNITANDNGQWGITAAKVVRITGATAMGNGVGGVVSNRSLRLRGSVATGNGVADVASMRRPRLRTTTCDTSRKVGEPLEILSESWLACPGE